MSFHVSMEQIPPGMDAQQWYRTSLLAFAEDTLYYRHLSWRIHKYSHQCPICLVVQEYRKMMEDLYKAKSSSQEEDDDESSDETAGY